jgi:4-carboxymuconolactone decarboxylase
LRRDRVPIFFASTSTDGYVAKGLSRMDYTERLRRLALNDASLAGAPVSGAAFEVCGLDPKTLALVRLAALVAVGGAPPSYGSRADDAVGAGATATEIVDVLAAVAPIVGVPCIVAAAPSLAMALGYDTDEALEQ